MSFYQLFLDESGDFKEIFGKKPSIIAGYLIKGSSSNAEAIRNAEAEALSLLNEIKLQKPEFYASINPMRLHGKEDYEKECLPYFYIELFKKLILEPQDKNTTIRLVQISNKENFTKTNSDETYLNTLSEGVVELMKLLLRETTNDDEEVHINITYATRLDVDYNERTGHYTSIEIQKYERYIKTKINTLLTFMPEQRSKMHYNLNYEKADYSAALHIADSICFALRGCRDDFFDKPIENDTKKLYDELETLKNNRKYFININVANGTLINTIKDTILNHRLAEGMCNFFSHKKLEYYQPTFLCMLMQEMEKLSSDTIKKQYQATSDMINSLILENHLNEAQDILARMIPCLENCLSKNYINKWFLFDLNYLMLTIATHKGNINNAERLISKCDTLLNELPIDNKNIDYIIGYKLRICEHYKNIFDFNTAQGILAKLANQERLLKQVNSSALLNINTENIKSDLLGKILSSYVQCYIYNPQKHDAKSLQEAYAISEQAIAEFNEANYISRQYQYRAALEVIANNPYKAFGWLYKSIFFKDITAINESNTSPIVEYIQEKNDLFALMHYANIMEKAEQADMKILYDSAIQILGKTFIDKLVTNRYPNFIIKWKFTKAKLALGYAKQNIINQEYNTYINSCTQNLNDLTTYCMGLGIAADKSIMLLPLSASVKETLGLLKQKYTTLHYAMQKTSPDSEIVIPESIKTYFTEWNWLVDVDLTKLRFSKTEMIDRLKNMLNSIPML